MILVMSVVVLGVLPIIESAPALGEISNNEGSLWILGENNNSDVFFWNETAVLITSSESLHGFSCGDKEDGVFRDPKSCMFYYRCWRGRTEVYKCLNGHEFDTRTVRCERQDGSECDTKTNSQLMCLQRRDGLHPNYTSGCQSYFRCENSTLTQSYSCDAGFAFSLVEQTCVLSSEAPCVEPHCAATSTGFSVTPGTRCRGYYSCDHGLRTDFTCPVGGIYDREKQVCVTWGAPCYEPLCTGRVNGHYPDTSHDCRRAFQCSGGKLTAVFGCPLGRLHNGHACLPAASVSCQSPESTAIALSIPGSDSCAGLSDGPHQLPDSGCRAYIICRGNRQLALLRCSVGLRFNGHRCTQENIVPCRSECFRRTDGYHVDFNSGCQEYFYCVDGQIVSRKTCSKGTLYNGHMCVPSPLYECPSVQYVETVNGSSECAGLADGYHTDYSSGCKSYFFCAGGDALLHSSCGAGEAWNGERCADKSEVMCEGPEPSPDCAGVEPGLYPDRTQGSHCRRYYYCAGGNRTRLACSHGRLFNGEACVTSDAYTCPSVQPDSCDERPDGYYRDPDSGCRSYFYCSSGHKITYVCSGSYMFDGKECVDPTFFKCPYSSDACIARANGYHYDKSSSCHKYFYCLGGAKIITLTCAANKVFDGRRCVEPVTFQCPGMVPVTNPCLSRLDGQYADTDSHCQHYYHCVNHKTVSMSTCPEGKVFDGSTCVDARTYHGCLAMEVAQDLAPSSHCTNTLNGFYQNYTTGCKSYFFCIDGMKTSLKCQGNELFNGQLCVDSDSYTCPSVPTPPIFIETEQNIKTDYQTYSILYIFPSTRIVFS